MLSSPRSAEFASNHISDVVESAHRDVIDNGLPELLNNKADAAFFDLPDASAVVPAAARALKFGGRFCAFCPCIEQSSRVSETLRSHGFNGASALWLCLHA